MQNQEWYLKDLKIELSQWGEFKGKYIGKITFENKSSDCFMFTLSPEEIAEYMKIISRKVVLTACTCGGWGLIRE